VRDILLLAVTLVCSIKALHRPLAGLLAFVFYGLFAPQTWVWFIARDLPHSQIIGICTILGYLLSSERKRLPIQRESILMALLWVFFGISTLFAVEQESALQKFIIVSKILLMVFLSTSIVNNEERIHLLLRVMALAIGLYGLKGAVFFLDTGGEGMVGAPEGSPLAGNNAIGVALVMNLPLLFYLVKTESHVWLRRLFKVMLIASYPAILGTFSRGAWIAAVIVTLLLFWSSKRKLILLTGALLAGVVVTLFPALLDSILSERVVSRYETMENIDEDLSSQARLWSWEFCKRVGLENPLVGAGFKYYSVDAYAKYYPEMLSRWPGKEWSCHSSWLQVLGEHGVLGFSLWFGLLISSFMSLRRIRSYGRAFPEMRWVVQLSEMLEISLVGFVIGGTFLDFAYFEGYYELVAVIVVMKELVYMFYPIGVHSEPITPGGVRRIALTLSIPK
jgi:putative inorganic carbon (HCO3(-)) transporter